MTPAAYLAHPRELSPALRRVFVSRGWIDGRTVTRIERPDPEHVARLYRIAGLEEAAKASGVVA